MKPWISGALVAGAALSLATVSFWASAQLRPLGHDPLWGFLFSPYPELRLLTVLQFLGAVFAYLGALFYLKWLRRRGA